MRLADAVTAVAFKTLVTVDLPRRGSNQHEINGVAALRDFFETGETVRRTIRWRYLTDDEEAVEDDGQITFYDARAEHPTRTEWRLYYKGDFLAHAEPDDKLIVIRTRDDQLFGLILPTGSAVLRSAVRLFGDIRDDPRMRLLSQRELEAEELTLPEQMILEALGIEVVVPPSRTDEDIVAERFGDTFPPTREMSGLARELSGFDFGDNPDETLVGWISREEELFRALERTIVNERLRDGFDDVDDFVSYSLSVQNRRKSRMGHALQNQLEAVLNLHGLTFEPEVKTEANNKPDFLFPGRDAYHDLAFPPEQLAMLAAKSTCKERWRQVLSEADRIETKHLCTLEQAISEAQTEEMSRQNLHLVVPDPYMMSYTDAQRDTLWTLERFIRYIADLQP